MLNRVVNFIISMIGALIGYALSLWLIDFIEAQNLVVVKPFARIATHVIGVLVFAVLLYLLTPWLKKKGYKLVIWTEKELQNIPPTDIMAGSIGLIIGLIIAYLISQLLINIPIPFVGNILSAFLYLFMGFLGIRIATRNTPDILALPAKIGMPSAKEKGKPRFEEGCKPKILDTSVIIDGRIADISKTGFIEGPLVIPEFVLEELRHIADSSDSLKRNRGRRGLDILNKIQKELEIEVVIVDIDFEDVSEVDSKLVKLAQQLKGKVVTNDFNLNKVADLQGVEVLNINDLTNAVKSIVLAGEEMSTQIIKEGKEVGQGVGYLDDGTMIVVDGGRRHVGRTVTVNVTSVLQTSAGRMIFAKMKNGSK